MKSQITFDQFLQIEQQLAITLGKIIHVERVPKSKKLLKLLVDFGAQQLTVVTNIGQYFPQEIIHGQFVESDLQLLGNVFPFIVNLMPTTIMGIESHAMILIPKQEDTESFKGLGKDSHLIGLQIF